MSNIKTLVVDGNNLIKIGFHGLKNYYHKKEHIGAMFHFMNTLRRMIDNNNYDKVVVFWDGEDNRNHRKLFYPEYKANREEGSEDFKEISITKQKKRVMEYLEEVYVRQLIVDGHESDDLIAYYCQKAVNEKITIFSGDSDLLQLINERVSVYEPKSKLTYNHGDFIKIKDYLYIPHQNISTLKILNGDSSDNIEGIYYMGYKTIKKLFPEITSEVISLDYIIDKAKQMHLKDKNNRALQNLLSGKTKSKILGEEFFDINKKLIDLSEPLVSEDAKILVEELIIESLDSEGRSSRNLMKMMNKDGIFKFLPKNNDWTYFFSPFLKLSRKEKNRKN